MTKPQLVCPAGSLAALKAAVDNGADDVYLGFRNDTNARNFAGLNFDDKSLAEGIRYAHQRGRKVLAAINTYAQASRFADWTRAVDKAAELGIDAVIIADPAVLDYAAKTHPAMRRHLSVQASATSYEAINFCREKFGIQRAVLPRVLTLAQVENVIRNTEVEIEVFGFGSLCVMNEGRCWLSSYATGETYYAMEEPASLNVLEMLPEIIRIGIAAIKVEGRQRSPTYVAQVTRNLRQALDAVIAAPEKFAVKPAWAAELGKVAEGSQITLGAYNRPWR